MSEKPKGIRYETFEDLNQSMLETHGAEVWEVMHSYIHSPLVVEQIKESKNKRKRKKKAPRSSASKVFTINDMISNLEKNPDTQDDED